MKAIFVPSALFLAAIATVFLNAPQETAAFVCLPGFCDSVTCTKITKCDGIVRAKGSTCGCCPLCVKQLRVGESCVLEIFMGGGAKEAECGAGLICDRKNLTCAPLR